jgi:DNA-directed RNA polymerase specialized sigma24 family protein
MQAELESEYVDHVTSRLATLRRLALLLCGDEYHSDDLVQQTITKLCERWLRARIVTSLDRYVRTMLVRAFLDDDGACGRRGWRR